jgi:hypothetical protein
MPQPESKKLKGGQMVTLIQMNWQQMKTENENNSSKIGKKIYF